MKPTRLMLALLLAFPSFSLLSAADYVDDFLMKLTGTWYLVSFQGGITGGTTYYHPACGDSVTVSRVPGTDSLQICEYKQSLRVSRETYAVCWSNVFNNWQLCYNGHQTLIEITPYSFTTYQTESVRKYTHTVEGLNPCNPAIEVAANTMKGRWYLTSMGAGPFEIRMTPVAGDSIILQRIEGTDSIHGDYYHNCLVSYTDSYRLVIDSSYSEHTDALMFVNQSAVNRMLVTVLDRKIILKTDSLPGHFMVFEPVDTFTMKRAPLITGVTGDTVCGSGEMTLMASSDPGEIRWYSDPQNDTNIATGKVFFPPELTVTTTYYVDATYNNCVTPERKPVKAVVIAVPEITNITGGARCGEGQVLLAAEANAGTIYWYADSTAADAMAEGPEFNTPGLTNTTVYFVGAVNEGCSSISRLPVTACISYSDTCSVNSVNQALEHVLQVYPDPTTGRFEINIEKINENPGMMSIYNTSGILVYQIRLAGQNHTIQADVTDFPGGIYFVILQGDSEVHTLKILKE
ncbi:MAG TPA: T9SS type A sorting domain-containing protein [Bacteroidales bacterium]|nr:T9SS type A sorting domain-containing protein [Bacteroidales bacterium]